MITLKIKRWLKPVKGEEWIEEMREREFWISEKNSYPEALYSRLTKSYFGWWSYCHLHSLWSRATLLIDPLSSGGLWSHVRCFLFNAIVVDVWWPFKHRVWKLFHQREWQEQCRFSDAAIQAMKEGCSDLLSPPPGFENSSFHGELLGERYFKRVAEILHESKVRHE